MPSGLIPARTDVFTISAWHKEIGDLVQQGETIATVKSRDSDNTGEEVQVPSPAFGILARKSVLEGDGIEVGEPMGVLSGVPETLVPAATGVPDPFAAPLYLPRGPEEIIPRSTTDQMLALHNARSLRTSPHVITVTSVNLTEVMRLRERVAATLTEREGIVLDTLPFILSVVGTALLRYPLLNAQLNEKAGEIRIRHYVSLAFTVRREDGPAAAPVIHDPEKKSILGLARTVADLKARARTNTLISDEIRGATFTITEVPASEGILWQTPIIHQPQAAILSVGSVTRVPAVREDDTIVACPLLHLSLSHDARVVDGETAAQFLAYIKQGLEDARFLFAER
jgi:pyruvate dehydrogenase E2 component (dihydrolipoamide acetyltransferase)